MIIIVLSKKTIHILQVPEKLSFSYHNLPYYLKSCFLYFGTYPEDYSIKSSRLFKHWVAEGFVKEDRKGKTLEEVAKEFLSELIHRSFVQVSTLSVDGDAKCCLIHNLMHKIILLKVQS